MPTAAQLAELASQMYVGNPSIGAKEDKSGIQFDSNSSTAKALGLTPGFALWSSREYTALHAYYRVFGTTSSDFDWDDRGTSYVQAVCVGE